VVEVAAPALFVDVARAGQLREVQDSVGRRAQLMAGIGQEGAFHAAGGPGLGARGGQGQRDLTALGGVLDDPQGAGMLRVVRDDRLADHAAQRGCCRPRVWN